MSKPLNWSIAKIWNDAFETALETIIPRNYLYASEVGSSFIDVFHKMKGIPYSNSPTTVAKRKMEAGKVWEAIILFVLKRAGILKLSQHKVDYALPGCLEVHGRIDFLAGGPVVPQQSEDFTILTKVLFQELGMPKVYLDIADRVLEMVKEMKEGPVTYLKEYVFDAKSVSSFVYDLIEGQGKPSLYHTCQIFHYAHGLHLPEGKICYVNRDDCRLMEMTVFDNPENLALYRDWVEKMTDYWNAGEVPPKEDLIIFNPLTFRFYKNTMGVEWSRYLTRLYGYASPNDFRDYAKPIVDSANRVFARCVESKDMTAKNRDVIREIKKMFPAWDDYVEQAKIKGLRLIEAEEREKEKNETE